MRILNIGHVLIDENTSEKASYTSAGGVPIFMNKIYKKLPDADYTIVSQYGKDFESYRNDLHLYPTNPTLEHTPRYVNVSSHGARTQKAFYRDGVLPVDIGGALEDLIKDADMIITSPLFPTFSPDYLKKVFGKARPECLKILLPQGYYRNFDDNDNVIKRTFIEANDVSHLFNFVILSEEDGDHIDKDVRQWATQSKTMFVITRGKKGCSVVSSNISINIPVNPLEESKIVDSVGSGDIFAASFSYKYALTHDLLQSGKFANAVARECLLYTPDQLDNVELESLKTLK